MVNGEAMQRQIDKLILPIAIVTGIAGYFIYTAIPALDATHVWVLHTVEVVQPVLIFLMLFITFCKVRVRDLRFSRWHLYALLMQVALFALCALAALSTLDSRLSTLSQCAMLCFICPTATAAAVVTAKLGGNVGSLTTYTIIINLAAALLLPLVIPMLHTDNAQSSILNPSTFQLFNPSILTKLFPLLIGPLLLAMLLRWVWPRLTTRIASVSGVAFYIWAVSLTLAIAMSVKALVHSHASVALLVGIAVVSVIACAAQFAFGHFLGKAHDDRVSATQSCGQKNTVFAMWVGYTFLNPLTALAGGFYSIWHNLYNAKQINRYEKTRRKT